MGRPAGRADAVPGRVSRGAPSGSLDGFLPSYRAAGGLLLECCQTQVSALQKDTEKLRRLKKKAPKVNQRLEKTPDSETLKELIHSINQKEDGEVT